MYENVGPMAVPVKKVYSKQLGRNDNDWHDCEICVGGSHLKCGGGKDERVGWAGYAEPLKGAVESP